MSGPPLAAKQVVEYDQSSGGCRFMLTHIARAATTSERFSFKAEIVARPQEVKPMMRVPSSLHVK